MSDTNNNPSTLHVPNSRPRTSGLNSIMDAYNSQSKIQLYDDNSAMNCDDISGVKGRDIPLAALRPKQPSSYDETGKTVYSKSKIAEDIDARNDIMKAYNQMNGQMDESSEDDYEDTLNDRFSQVEDAEIEYIEDVPDSNEGLLHYLETCIKNAEANLEMLKSLYAALR